MDFLINEGQLRFILLEQDKSKLDEYMKSLYSSTNKIISSAEKRFKFNLKMLTTWGASVGGLIVPLDNYIRHGNFKLSETQEVLVLIGIACTFFYDNSSVLSKIRQKIKEEGIEDTYKVILKKARNLEESFLKFLSSLNVSIGSSLEMIAYSFLIPIITDIQDMVMKKNDVGDLGSLISERLISSGVVIVTAAALTKVINKMIERVR